MKPKATPRRKGRRTAPETSPAPRRLRRASFPWVLGLLVFLSGCVYVGCRWSPSSYSIVLDQLGVRDNGLVIGAARAERGDEFGWQTPLVQMAIHSHFERFDRTPPYFEDLRSLYALPILDWGLVFKPQLWLFLLAPPAVAYSFWQFLMIAMFVVGFTILFIRLGGHDVESLLMAITLFFAAYTQYWWNGAANFLFPFFPWIVLALLWRTQLWLRLALFYYLATCGVLSYFYPPNAIALAFVGAILLGVAAPELFRPRSLAGIVGAGAAAVGTSVFYLREALVALADTVYPGNRVVGGGGVSLQLWLSQFFPTALEHKHVSLVKGVNICELSTLGSVYLLGVLCFVPWRSLWREADRPQRWRWALLVFGLVATEAWMTVRLPAWSGYALLWHRVPPGRMVLAGGLLLMTTAFLLGSARPLRLTAIRSAAFALAVLSAWFYFKHRRGIGFMDSWRDWIVLVPVLGLAALWRARELSQRTVNIGLLASAAFAAFVSFGTFNPLQRTDPIFATHRTPLTDSWERKLRDERRGFLIVPFGTSFFAYSGLPMIGLGYPALGYSTFAPAMDLWRREFPNLPEGELRAVFDNAGSLAFGDVPTARRVAGTLLTVAPAAPFDRPGVTVCDLIPDGRRRFASSVGCDAEGLRRP